MRIINSTKLQKSDISPVMRDFVLLYINGERHEIRGNEAFLNFSDYLRYQKRLTGTKIVCSEGDCGACTAMKWSPSQSSRFQAFNTCVLNVGQLDCSNLVTIEGLKKDTELHPIQKAMIDRHGAQCGFCTPGFVMAIANLFEIHQTTNLQRTKNHLTGNLCRCTGYQSIIDAADSLSKQDFQSVFDRYNSSKIKDDLEKHQKIPISIECGEKSYAAPTSIEVACEHKAKGYRIVSGQTDLGVRRNKSKIELNKVLSLNLVPELAIAKEESGYLRVGARLNLSDLQDLAIASQPEFSEFLNIFASPQIKNIATLSGNIANASPIADTVPYLFLTESKVHIAGLQGTRSVPIQSFFKGYKDIDLADDEIITSIEIPQLPERHFTRLYKISQRRDLDISCVNAAFSICRQAGKVTDFRLVYGGVAATCVRLNKIESHVVGKEWNQLTVDSIKEMIRSTIAPLSDVRGSRDFRMLCAERLFQKFFDQSQELVG